ncbi:TNF receptor-associated factor 6-like [Hydra vulgaris]|uniref:TNF receptor-associated factor 6-like n=1 Tax=Hydra vulgaris TaxID=6087 RepID=A0ABM4CDU9_HYDVU
MENLDKKNFGGYDAYFINELLDEHECPVCKMALREPIQTQCGHRLCLSCAEEMRKRNNGALICPLDNSILNSSKIFPDIAIERVIMQLKVKCSNFSNGCEWTGELKILNIHEEKCECLPLCCVNQCGMEILRKEMSSHITDSCVNTIIPCQYLNIGCNFKGMRKEHEMHANSSMQNHLSMAISKLDALENKITLTVDTLENKIASKVNALENKITLTVDALENKITSKVESLKTKVESKPFALENKTTSKVVLFENKNSSEVVALENKITSTVDALKNELISKVDAQKDKIMLHEKNLEIIKAYLAVETPQFVRFFSVFDEKVWCDGNEGRRPRRRFPIRNWKLENLIEDRHNRQHDQLSPSSHHYLYLNDFENILIRVQNSNLSHIVYGTLYSRFKKCSDMQKQFMYDC